MQSCLLEEGTESASKPLFGHTACHYLGTAYLSRDLYRLWDIETGKVKCTLECHFGSVKAIVQSQVSPGNCTGWSSLGCNSCS